MFGVVAVRLFGWLEVWLLLCFYLVGGLIGFGISAVAVLELLCWFVVLVAVGDLWLQLRLLVGYLDLLVMLLVWVGDGSLFVLACFGLLFIVVCCVVQSGLVCLLKLLVLVLVFGLIGGLGFVVWLVTWVW